MPGRIPFTFNTMVLVPLLRSLPASIGVSLASTLIAMTGLDFGLLGLGHPQNAADDLVAWMMSFSIAAPAFWGLYTIVNAWRWAVGFVRWIRARHSRPPHDAAAEESRPADPSIAARLGDRSQIG
jgi:ABC-type dipeptide/oligopeptide/nickel transport system permease component